MDELTLRCRDCDAPYREPDGWEGRCAVCCSLADDHVDGRHETRPRLECRACRLGEPGRARRAA